MVRRVRLVPLRVAGGGGRQVHVNPAHVVCVLGNGEGRSQIVTTGLSGETSMSLIVEGDPELISEWLEA